MEDTIEISCCDEEPEIILFGACNSDREELSEDPLKIDEELIFIDDKTETEICAEKCTEEIVKKQSLKRTRGNYTSLSLNKQNKFKRGTKSSFENEPISLSGDESHSDSIDSVDFQKNDVQFYCEKLISRRKKQIQFLENNNKKPEVLCLESYDSDSEEPSEATNVNDDLMIVDEFTIIDDESDVSIVETKSRAEKCTKDLFKKNSCNNLSRKKQNNRTRSKKFDNEQYSGCHADSSDFVDHYQKSDFQFNSEKLNSFRQKQKSCSKNKDKKIIDYFNIGNKVSYRKNDTSNVAARTRSQNAICTQLDVSEDSSSTTSEDSNSTVIDLLITAWQIEMGKQNSLGKTIAKCDCKSVFNAFIKTGNCKKKNLKFITNKPCCLFKNIIFNTRNESSFR